MTVCTIVIDGANVACQKGGTPSISKLAAALAYFQALEAPNADAGGSSTDDRAVVKCIAFVPNFWLNTKASAGEKVNDALQAADRALLQELVELDHVVLTPSQAHDDFYVIDYAVKHDGFIVTNDMFRDHVTNKRTFHGTRLSSSWVRAHCIDFTFVGREFLPNPRAMERVQSYTPGPAVPPAPVAALGASASTSSAVVAGTKIRAPVVPLPTSTLAASIGAATGATDSGESTGEGDDISEMDVDQRARLKRTIDLSEVTHYKVPRHLLPYLHGEGGETMARFQDYTGTYIVLPSHASTAAPHVASVAANLSIYGPESSRLQAVGILDNFMREMELQYAHEQLMLQQQMQLQYQQQHHHHHLAYPEHHQQHSHHHAAAAVASATSSDDHMMDVDL